MYWRKRTFTNCVVALFVVTQILHGQHDRYPTQQLYAYAAGDGVNFDQVYVQHSDDAGAQDTTDHAALEDVQPTWLQKLFNTLKSRIVSLPSSREAPEHLTRYGDIIVTDTPTAETIHVRGSEGLRHQPGHAEYTAASDDPEQQQLVHILNATKFESEVEQPEVGALEGQWLLSDNLEARSADSQPPLPIAPGGEVDAWTQLGDAWGQPKLPKLTLDRVEDLPKSSYQCMGTTEDHRVCQFFNLVLWNGSLWYIRDEPAPYQGISMQHNWTLPRLPLSWVYVPDFQAEVLHVNMTNATAMPLDDLQNVEVVYIRDALLWLMTYWDNYGHLLGEHGPTIHSMLCTWFGRCRYGSGESEDVHLLFTNDDDFWNEVPQSVMEMFTCLSKEPPRTLSDPFFSDKLVIIGKALSGIGPSCRGFPWCRPRYRRQPPLDQMMLSWKVRMMDCFGLPNNIVAKSASDHPYLLFINRPAEIGRAFVNLEEIKAHIKERHPEFTVAVRYLDNMTMAQQAVLYHNVSMLVQMHGAALGNMIFLPRGACIVDVVPLNNDDKHPWVIYMGQDFSSLYYNPIIIPPQKTLLMWEKIKNTREYKLLSPQQKADLDRGICPPKHMRPEYDTYAVCNFAWFLKRSNVELNVGHIESAIQQAIAVLDSNAQRIKFVARRRKLQAWDTVASNTLPASRQQPLLNDRQPDMFYELHSHYDQLMLPPAD